MNYKETLKYISSAPKFSKMLGNDELAKLLESFENPQDSLKFVHIAGTNGKGSVAAMTAKISELGGYKTGLYISPFINVFNERIQINGENIPDADLARIATIVKEKITDLGLEISEFAQITAMAFLYFKEQNCDIVVLETGLGGRLDATNVIKTPIICAITKIGLDHTEYLGNTLSEIAAEKCGIIKNNAPVVTCANQDSEALAVIENECKKRGSALFTAPAATDYRLSLTGEYQKSNAAQSALICSLLGINENIIAKGLKSTYFPARFEFLKDNLIIDGAHNPDGADALVASLKTLGKPVILVSAMMEDKDAVSVCEKFSAVADGVITTELPMPRCMKKDSLKDKFLSFNANILGSFENASGAVEYALNLANDKIVCVCGSLYLAAEVRKNFIKK